MVKDKREKTIPKEIQGNYVDFMNVFIEEVKEQKNV